MPLHALMKCLVSLMIASPMLVEEKGVVGNWQLVGLEVDGQPVEDDDIGTRRLVFTQDGKMQAWDGETKDDDGWYELKDGGKLLAYRDEDGDGVLDDEEKANADEMTWTRDSDNLTLKMKLKSNGDKSPQMTAKLKRVEK